MKSLFLRIFLWFCGGTLMLLLVVGAGFLMDAPGAAAAPWWRLGQGAIVSAGRVGVEAYERGGRQELDRFLESLARDTGMRGTLYDDSGQGLSGGVIAPAGKQLSDALSGPEEQLTVLPVRGVAGVRLRGAKGRSYGFAVIMPRRERAGGWSRTFLFTFLLTSGLLCFLLARHLTAPVAHLRAVTSRFSNGDLGARVTQPELLGRKDEVGGLARDFNEMAARIETLLNAQKRLIADVSHELRSPLTRLSLALGLIRRRGDTVSPTSMARMEREVHRLNHLIGQLLTLSRLEALDQPPPKESIDLAALVQEIAIDAGFETTSSDRGVRLVECAACTLTGARDLLRSAIENVVRNALKYTSPGTVVQIRLARPSGANLATILVEDEGPGVPPNELARIFEPFYRVEQARERQTGGAGLGLAIARHVVGMHGGSVTAKNRESGGLALVIALPVQPLF
ncbi:sensor histidine kinase [Paludibaculum fermentans]|uniref:histidine kinase n=1 Tax=Paludibaculum fermentans TaxID=1473598 RepID=A0A7S7SLI4_PALFE|nr:ATP-binding protein [Paludibaculum fermentans]QOY88476.1 HAMP domain-containing protein [Paludibaculum fermentans]